MFVNKNLSIIIKYLVKNVIYEKISFFNEKVLTITGSLCNNNPCAAPWSSG